MKVLIKNRYGDTQGFEWNDSDKGYIWTGAKARGRISFDEDNNITFWDPEGGPFIAIKTNLNDIDNGLCGIVSRIVDRKDTFLLHIEEKP